MKKLLYWMVAVLMLFTLSITAFATNEASDGNIKIQVTTDKGSYGATGVAEITATITNVSGEDLNNVTAQAVFDDLAPAGKRTSEISKNTDVLKAGESISFTYKATLNQDEHNLNIFQKIILWFVRLFNSGYNANNNNIDVAIECVTEINFGKFKANNVVQVGYEESSIEVSDEDFRTFQDIRKSIELLSSAEQVVDVLEDEIKKGNIENYQVNENYITFVTESGIRGIWEDETLFDSENKSVSLDGKSNKVKKTPSGNSYKDIIKQVSSSSVISSLGDVAVIRPYRSTDFKYDDFVTTGEIIADAIGVDIDIFDNANASLSVLKDLDEYGVVLVAFFIQGGCRIYTENPYYEDGISNRPTAFEIYCKDLDNVKDGQYVILADCKDGGVLIGKDGKYGFDDLDHAVFIRDEHRFDNSVDVSVYLVQKGLDEYGVVTSELIKCEA